MEETIDWLEAVFDKERRCGYTKDVNSSTELKADVKTVGAINGGS
jgi:hypothetical protein